MYRIVNLIYGIPINKQLHHIFAENGIDIDQMADDELSELGIQDYYHGGGGLTTVFDTYFIGVGLGSFIEQQQEPIPASQIDEWKSALSAEDRRETAEFIAMLPAAVKLHLPKTDFYFVWSSS